MLTVEAESTAWATQLRMLAAEPARNIAAEVGHNVVTKLQHPRPGRAVVEPRAAPGAGPGPARHVRLTGSARVSARREPYARGLREFAQ